MISPRVLCLERRSWSTLRNSDSSSLKDSIFDLFTWPPARDVSPFTESHIVHLGRGGTAGTQKQGQKREVISLLQNKAMPAIWVLSPAPCTSHMYDKPRLQNLVQPPTAPSDGRNKSTGLARAAGSWGRPGKLRVSSSEIPRKMETVLRFVKILE